MSVRLDRLCMWASTSVWTLNFFDSYADEPALAAGTGFPAVVFYLGWHLTN